MRYLKMTLPAIILVVVLIVALRLYPEMAKSCQERENAAAEASSGMEESTAAEASSGMEESTAAEVSSGMEEITVAEASSAEAEETSAVSETALTNTAPDFELKDEYGMDGSLSDHFGKPIVVNFWATWCPYCVQELPLFEKYYQQYSEDIDFIIVDLADGHRETISMAKEYAAGNGYSFPLYFDTTGGSMYAYGITGIPVTLFIDSDGNLMTQHVGAIDEDTLVRNIQALGIDVQ